MQQAENPVSKYLYLRESLHNSSPYEEHNHLGWKGLLRSSSPTANLALPEYIIRR